MSFLQIQSRPAPCGGFFSDLLWRLVSILRHCDHFVLGGPRKRSFEHCFTSVTSTSSVPIVWSQICTPSSCLLFPTANFPETMTLTTDHASALRHCWDETLRGYSAILRLLLRDSSAFSFPRCPPFLKLFLVFSRSLFTSGGQFPPRATLRVAGT